MTNGNKTVLVQSAVVKTGAGSIEEAAGNLRKVTAELHAAVTSLRAAGWTGLGANAFYAAADRYQERQDENQRVLADISSATADSSVRYARHDEERASAGSSLQASLA